MADPADITAALVGLLLADTAIAAATAGRVFGGELPEGEAGAMPRAAIVITASGGAALTGDTYAGHDTQRVDLFAYAGTPRMADQLGRMAARVLRQVQRRTVAGVLVHWIKSAGGFASARDPDFAWPRSFQSFQAFHALDQVE